MRKPLSNDAGTPAPLAAAGPREPQALTSPVGGEFMVNTATAGNQSNAVIAVMANGGFVVAWRDGSMGVGGTPGDTSGTAVKAQMFSHDGQRIGGEILVNSAVANNQGPLQIAALGDGFVIAWDDFSLGVGGAPGDGSGSGIKAQVFDAAGTKLGGEVLVNTVVTGDQTVGAVTALADGGFLVTWHGSGAGADVNGSAIKAQLFDADGVKVGGEFIVNDPTAQPNAPFNDDEREPVVTALSNGGFAVAWGLDDPMFDPGFGSIYVQAFTAAGATIGTEVRVDSDTNLRDSRPEITALVGGGFAVAWRQSNAQFMVRLFDNDGVPQGAEIFVDGLNTTSNIDDTSHSVPKITSLAGGGFVMTWWGWRLPNNEDNVVRAQVFDHDGAKVGDIIEVAVGFDSNVVALWTGGFLVGWEMDGLYAQEFDELGGRVGGVVEVNSPPNGDRFQLAMLDDGFVALWDGFGDNGGSDSSRSVNARVYAVGGLVEGGPGDDTLTGTPGDDTLNGGPGADTMTGGNGDDKYIVDNAGDVVVEGPGGGNDSVSTTVDYTLGAGSHVERLTSISWALTTPLKLTGNEFVNLIEGNAGNNVLDGRGGADRLVGFGGDDKYVVDNAGDVVVEASGGGTDSISAVVDYTLALDSHVERLNAISFALTTPLKLTGNNFVNLIEGNAGNNTLDGRGGADTMVGFGGDDKYVVDNAGDVVTELAGGGYDSVSTVGDYQLAAGSHVERLNAISFALTTPLKLTGNNFVNLIEGNAGNNVLDGRGGADTMVGFGGNDQFVVDNAGDVVTELAGGGTDVVATLVDYQLGAGSHVERLTSISWALTTPLKLTGNEIANLIEGNAGANQLDGKLGADTLVGFGGADSFAFTTALGAGNLDFFADFVSGTDKILLDHTIFTGLPLGALSPDVFSSSGSNDGNDRIIFNPGLGFVYFDADGGGPGSAFAFVIVQPGGVVTASDFTVI